MQDITLYIGKDEVYEEVAQTTSYTGAKMEKDTGAYERIFTTDEDRSQLDRFWAEACIGATEALKKFLGSEESTAQGYRLNLELSNSFDPQLRGSMEKELFSYFVMSITGKWYVFTNKGEAAEYVNGARSMLEGVRRKACWKKKPRRPVY